MSVYKDFGFKDYSFRLSLRDKNNKEKYFDDDDMWETAESQLREILTELNLNFYEAEGEAAFYGPKLDVQIKTAVGHDVTISTCQLDFLLPQKFKLEYIGKDGELSEKKTSGVTAEQFKDLQKYMYTIIKQISKEILGGNIDLKPYYKDKKTPCKYCDYKSICSFNMGGCENSYNYIDKKSKEEILSKLAKGAPVCNNF